MPLPNSSSPCLRPSLSFSSPEDDEWPEPPSAAAAATARLSAASSSAAAAMASSHCGQKRTFPYLSFPHDHERRMGVSPPHDHDEPILKRRIDPAAPVTLASAPAIAISAIASAASHHRHSSMIAAMESNASASAAASSDSDSSSSVVLNSESPTSPPPHHHQQQNHRYPHSQPVSVTEQKIADRDCKVIKPLALPWIDLNFPPPSSSDQQQQHISFALTLGLPQ